MTMSRLWAFLAVALPVLATMIGSLATTDLTYHLRAGNEFLDTGRITVVDTWSFTALGTTWVNQQWGAQILFAAIFRVGGWTGLLLFRALLAGITFACIYAICRRRGVNVRVSASLTLAAFAVVAIALGLRPQAIGMAFFAILLYLVSDRRAHPRRLWAIPVLVLAWANIHGSFFFGPLVLGLAWLEDLHDRVAQPHRTLLIAVVSAFAACVTPFGPLVWVYAAGLSTNPEVTERIAEWVPTSIRSEPGLLFFGSVVAVVVLIARRGQKVPWPTLAWLGVFFLVGAYAARGIAWWPLAAVVAVAGLIGDPARDAQKPEPATRPLFRRLNLGIVGAFVLAGISFLPIWLPFDTRLNAPHDFLTWAPPGITAKLRSLVVPGDRVFNPQEWGSWFEYEMPSALVAMDSRIELYPATVWDDYDGVISGSEGWQDRVESWGVTIAVMAKRDEAMAKRLEAIGWRSVYSDKDGSISVAPGG
jgi:hypothetical protein